MFSEWLLFFICLCAIWKLWFRNKSKLEPPDLPGGYPFVGHGLLFLGDGISNYINIIKMAEDCLKKGSIVSCYFGFRKTYCISDPDALQTISNTCLEKDYFYNFFKPYMGEGLFTSNVPKWKKHRKLLNAAFSPTVLNSFMDIFNSQARDLVDKLALHLGKPFDHYSTLRLNILETICLTITGVGGDEYSHLQKDYVTLIPKAIQKVHQRFRKFWFTSDFMYNRSKLKKETDKIVSSILELSKKILQNKKAEINITSETYQEQNTVKRQPFLELLLDSAEEINYFNDSVIREETDTILSTGHETTANSMNIALLVLGSYPDVQEKVLNEILQVVGGSDRDLGKDDLSKLIYTEAVLKETLRLYPIAPVVSRYIDKDVKLDKYTLKANSSCFFMFYGLNRHPIWSPDADQFKPERWLDTTRLPNLNYFGSFSVGKRNCIGKVYAMMTMKTILGHVLRRYQISADISKVVFKWQMMTYPASGHHYTLQKRNK